MAREFTTQDRLCPLGGSHRLARAGGVGRYGPAEQVESSDEVRIRVVVRVVTGVSLVCVRGQWKWRKWQRWQHANGHLQSHGDGYLHIGIDRFDPRCQVYFGGPITGIFNP